MSLLKYCNEKYNIAKGCPTIQLGTLQYYRELDPSFTIADPNEGKYSFIIEDYDPVKGQETGTSQFVPIHARLGNVIMMHTFPNCYIFCLSADIGKNYLEMGKTFSPEYNSYYKITDIDTFSIKLANILVENITLEHLNLGSQNKEQRLTLGDIKSISVRILNRFIKYWRVKSKIISNSKFQIDTEDLDPISRFLFTKDSKFKEEREFRIAFLFEHPKFGTLSVKKAPILLPINVFAHEIQI